MHTRQDLQLFAVCLHTHFTIGRAKVARNGLLSALQTRRLRLVAVHAVEQADLQHARDLLYPLRQRRDFPAAVLARPVAAGRHVLGRQQLLEWRVDDVEALVGLNRAGLRERVLSDLGALGAEDLELAEDGGVADGRDFDGDRGPVGQQAGLLLAVVGDADEALAARGHELLLEEAGAAALDAVELGVDLVGAVEADVQHGVAGQRVEGDGHQAGLLDDLARVPAGRHEPVHVALGRRVGLEEVLDGFDAVDDGAAAADADEAVLAAEVVLDGAEGGLALCALDRVELFRGRGDGVVGGHDGRCGEGSSPGYGEWFGCFEGMGCSSSSSCWEECWDAAGWETRD